MASVARVHLVAHGLGGALPAGLVADYADLVVLGGGNGQEDGKGKLNS